MKNAKSIALGMCMLTIVSGFSFTSCSTKQGTGTLIGTGAGAALGSVIGAIAGHGKGAAIGAAIGSAVGAGTGAIIGRHMDKVAQEAAQQVPDAQVEEVTDANGLKAVKVTFDSGILFATGSSTLSATAKNSLAKFAEVLKQNTDCDVAVQGYTDNAGWKNSTAEQSVQKNLNLSQQRAQAVTNYLNSLGVSNNQIRSTTGFGEANPVADNSTAAGKAQNRRVEIYLYASQAMIDAANAGTLQ